MDQKERKNHWEQIYKTKKLNEVSWYQPVPKTSLEYFEQVEVPLSAKIIDIGGGDSFLVDALLELGYSDITVLDISATALQRAKKRLGEKSVLVKWIEADAASFKPEDEYDVWHDRAAFHFLTKEKEVVNYIQTVKNSVASNGIVIIGTFSKDGPKKCSGIEIQQYSEASIVPLFVPSFKKIKCTQVSHHTPFDTVQDFIFCIFRKY